MLKSLEISGFKSFANKSTLEFDEPISAIVGPNGSGKSNAAEAFRFVLGEQSLKALRVSKTEELLFNGGQSGRRRNRAHVKAKFDNSENTLDIDYGEVVVERIIERGEASTYRLNGSNVRLKDVTDLLADANIGTSRHHIISQGESDRILSVTNRQRKSIIEDALGLGGYYRRRQEAQNKLERTEDNLEKIQTQLEEIKPEFEYLKKKKHRIKETKKLREQLTEKYQQYFRRQQVLLSRKEDKLQEKQVKLKNDLADYKQTVSDINKQLEKITAENSKNEQEEKIKELRSQLNSVQEKLKETNQKRAEITGSIQALEDTNKADKIESDKEKVVRIERSIYEKYQNDIQDAIDARDDQNDAKTLERIVSLITEFFDIFPAKKNIDANSQDDKKEIDRSRIQKLKVRREEISKQYEQLKDQKQEVEKELASAQEESSEKESKKHKLEKQLLKAESNKDTTATKLETVTEKMESLEQQRTRLDEEMSEAKVLCGPEALEFEDVILTDENNNEITSDEISQKNQRKFSRELERLKVKLEETRVSDPQEVSSEFERVKERIEFFQKEIEDLTQTQSQLRELIDDIEKTAERKFRAGVEDINNTFDEFFSTMFGGGSAELVTTEHPAGRNVLVDNIEESPDEIEIGIDIKVKLPNKKIRGLDVLSGGERALTSVALLFALSQINPPPFMVLDEADAALDEANSRRFGNIVEKLSERSQLIIITHNRETMRRADLLYGVTMKKDGSSRLLSLDFSEAVDKVDSS